MTDIPARVAHVGIAVPSIAHALAFYQDILGLEPGRPEAADGATIVGLTLGDVQIELLEPRDPASPVAQFRATTACSRPPDCPRCPGGRRARATYRSWRARGRSAARRCSRWRAAARRGSSAGSPAPAPTMGPRPHGSRHGSDSAG